MADELTKLKAPDDASSVSWRGTEYPVTDGSVAVPDAAVPDLLPFGFSVAKAKKGA